MAVYYDNNSKKWRAEPWLNKQRLPSKSFANKALAQKYERDTLAEAEKRLLNGSQAEDYTYNEVYDFWYISASSRKRETSLVKDAQMHHQYIAPILGELKVSQISSMHFEKIISAMLKKGLSKASVNKVIQHFKAVFNHSFKHEYIARNPSRNFKQLRLDYKEMEYLSQDEMDQLLSYTHHKYIGAERWKHVLYLTLFLTGGRLGEVLGLEWHRIQFDQNSILIGQIWCAISNRVINTTKGKKDRVVPLNSLLKTELRGMKNFSKGSFLFSNVSDKPIDPSHFRSRQWVKDLKAAGIRKIRIHDARHTYASLFVMSGGSIYDLKKVLGHSDLKTTEKYAHLSSDHLAGVRDIIKPNIGSKAEVINLDVTHLSRKTGRDQVEFTQDSRMSVN